MSKSSDNFKITRYRSLQNNPASSVFVTTYNQPRHLSLVLAGLETQTFKSFEVMICDDGSRHDTEELIKTFAASSELSIIHIWQPDNGFRKCRILNEGLRNSAAPYCIFLDGDCIPHPRFVEDHLSNMECGTYLAGRRVDLGPIFSETITPEIIKKRGLHIFRTSYLLSHLKRDSKKIHLSLRIGPAWIRKLLGYMSIPDLKGCNYSLATKDILEINGFDESYEGYGREDTDVEIRLKNAGLKLKSIKGIAVQFHVWHKEREFVPSNDDRLNLAIREKRIKALKGVSKCPPSSPCN